MVDDTSQPLFLNPAAGSAAAVAELVRDDRRFAITECEPGKMHEKVSAALQNGARRILVSGGDGTIAAAANAIAKFNAENPGDRAQLAILPGGTLNHFAHDLGIPDEMKDALEVALGEHTLHVDAASVNGQLFLNTSSVGAYVNFVRERERLESWFGYRVASVIAAFRMLAMMRPFRVELEVNGVLRHYRSPLVFVGVGEREAQVPMLGKRVANGKRGLHVIVVRSGARGRLLALAVAAAMKGLREVARTPHLDSFIVDRCRIDMRRKHGTVATDGELVPMTTPLLYESLPDALTVVAPSPVKGDSAAA